MTKDVIIAEDYGITVSPPAPLARYFFDGGTAIGQGLRPILIAKMIDKPDAASKPLIFVEKSRVGPQVHLHVNGIQELGGRHRRIFRRQKSKLTMLSAVTVIPDALESDFSYLRWASRRIGHVPASPKFNSHDIRLVS